MPSFSSIGDFVRFMEAKVASLPAVQRHVLEQSAKLIQHSAQRAIGTYDYGWPQLADATQKDRVAKGFPANEPLLRTGELERSIQYRVIDPWHASVGSDNDKAVWQELGTSKIPARSFLAATASRKEAQIRVHLSRAVFLHLSGGNGLSVGAGPPIF